MSEPAAEDVVRAAGVVVLRHQDFAPEVLIVHRPHRSDWSLPKGKVDPGEHPLDTAVRECAEETGLAVTLGSPLAQQSYMALGRPKIVDYWRGLIRSDQGFTPNAEIDELRWVPVTESSELLTYAHDRELVTEALELPETSPVVILRHAKAMKRSEYDGKIDGRRPLAAKGRNQSRALVSLLDAFGITVVHSSDSTRCIETVKAFARLLGTKVMLEKALSEEAHREHPLRAATSVRHIIESPEASVICSHRPVMATILGSIADSLGLSADDPRLDPKLSPGAFVVIHRAFADGAIRAVAIERHDAPLSDGEDHDLLG